MLQNLKFSGIFSDDPYCVERSADPLDQCCVLVICSDAFEDEDETEENFNSFVTEAKQETSTSSADFAKVSLREKSSSNEEENLTSNLEFLQITPRSIQIQVRTEKK